MLKIITKEIELLKDDKQKEILERFFKMGKGEYGEGDVFLGIKVPQLRKIAKNFYNRISIEDVTKLLHSKYHEFRLTALFIFILKYEKEDNDEREVIYRLYLENTKYINNWDLIDLSSLYIVGRHIYKNNINKEILYKLISTNNLWNIRIAILATYYFIKNNDFKDILKMSKLLLDTKEDLIKKALGWMLREVGKRDYKVLYNFLKEYYKVMPRTMLRYAIERMDKSDKEYFMN